jgi:hypothetical protein
VCFDFSLKENTVCTAPRNALKKCFFIAEKGWEVAWKFFDKRKNSLPESFRDFWLAPIDWPWRPP